MRYFCLFTFLICAFYANSQTPESLRFPPDARSSAMGDAGLATAPDAASQYWNVAKYAFAENKGGLAFSYTPWMRSITDDMNLLYLSGYAVIGAQSISASLRYFSAGDIDVANIETSRVYSPSDIAFDLGYSRRFGEFFSLGLTFRYISTHYQSHNTSLAVTTTGAFAADIGAYFRLPLNKNEWTWGLAFTNIGTKLDMGDEQEAFLPMNLGIGTQYAFHLPKNSALRLALDANKSLVPQDDPDAGVVSGLFSSFGNDMRQITISVGMEYSFKEKLFLRGGYYYNNPDAGDRSHATVGVGLCFYNINFDCSYLVATGNNNIALKNTVCFTLGCTFGKTGAPKKQSSEQMD